MEKKGMSTVLMACLVFGIVMGQSRAQIAAAIGCYATCFIPCMLDPTTKTFYCAMKCLRDCILPKSTVGLKDNKYFCKLGCSIALCSNFSTKQDPAEKKVESCVDACSLTCAKKN